MKKWCNIVLFSFAVIILTTFSFASSVTIDNTTYSLTSKVSYLSHIIYTNQTNLSIETNYLINNTNSINTNCTVFIDNKSYEMNKRLNDFNTTFMPNKTQVYNYNITCQINNSINISSQNQFSAFNNSKPVFSNISNYNITDYFNISINLTCSDQYNDTIKYKLKNSTGIITNSTYSWIPTEKNVSKNPYNITIECNDTYFTINKTFSINVSSRNISLNISYPINRIINKTQDYFICEAGDKNSLFKLFAKIENTTYAINNSDKIIITINSSENKNITSSCWYQDIYKNNYTIHNRNFTVDIIPPGIDNLSISRTYTTSTINFKTTESTNAISYVGFNESFFHINKTSNIIGSYHTIKVTNLTKNTDYYIYVRVCDQGNLCSSSYKQMIHTYDCRYEWECSEWNACQEGNKRTRTCNCKCEEACVGDRTTEEYCKYVKPNTDKDKITNDDKTYRYVDSVSKKIFRTSNINWDVNQFDFNSVNIELNNNIETGRLVISSLDKNNLPFDKKERAIEFFEISSTNLESIKTIKFNITANNNQTKFAKYQNSKWHTLNHKVFYDNISEKYHLIAKDTEITNYYVLYTENNQNNKVSEDNESNQESNTKDSNYENETNKVKKITTITIILVTSIILILIVGIAKITLLEIEIIKHKKNSKK